jgi:hypothetical protein
MYYWLAELSPVLAYSKVLLSSFLFSAVVGSAFSIVFCQRLNRLAAARP